MTETKTHFKGWAIPGPKINPTQPGPLAEPEEPVSLDSISGHYRILQLKNGHRFSTDDLLIAWRGTQHCSWARRVLDLGSGIGSVGMIAAWRLPHAQLVTIEAQARSIALARESIRINELTSRYEIREGDFRDPKHFASHEKFDLVLGSPPYFPLDSGLLGDHPQKVECRFETRGDIRDYCRVAAERLEAGGTFCVVFPISPAHQLERVRSAALDSELTIIEEKPITLREGEVPLLGVFLMMRSIDLPEALRAKTHVATPLTIRTSTGEVHPEYRVAKLSIGFPP